MARVLAGVLIGAALLGAVASSGRADGVTDEISQALDAYRAGDLNGAANALDAAGTLIRQAKAAKLKAYLPEPLPGWTAKDAESAAVGSAMFGGGTTVTRRYTKGNSSVEVSIITDSPMMSALASMFSGGFLVTDEVQPLVVDGHQMIHTKDDNSYHGATADKKVLLQVKGSGAVDDDTLRAYVRGIKFAALERVSSKD